MPSNVNINNDNNVNNNNTEGSNTKLIGTVILLIAFIFGVVYWYVNNDNNETIIGESLQQQEEKESTEDIESEDSLKVSTTENNQILLIKSVWWQDYLISFAIFVGVFAFMVFFPWSPLRLNNKAPVAPSESENNLLEEDKKPGKHLLQRCYIDSSTLGSIEGEKTNIENKEKALKESKNAESPDTSAIQNSEKELEDLKKSYTPNASALRRLQCYNIMKGSLLYFFHSLIYVFCYLLIFSLKDKFCTSYSFSYILKNAFFHALSMKNYYVIWNAFLLVLGFSLYATWFGNFGEEPFGIKFLSKTLPGYKADIKEYKPVEKKEEDEA